MNKFALYSAAIVFAVSATAQNINVNNRVTLADQSVESRLINFPSAAASEGAFSGGGVQGAGWVAQFAANGVVLGTSVGDTNPFRSGALAGILDFRTGNPAADRTAAGNAGAVLSIEVRVWDSTVFSSWDAASTALAAGRHTVATAVGRSTFDYTIPANTTTPGATSITGFRSFDLTYIPAVPEPTTIALGALGAAALLWRRRK